MPDPLNPPAPVPPANPASAGATPLEQMQQVAKDSVREASQAAEEFREDFKLMLSQIFNPDSWREGLKLFMQGGLGLLQDLQEMLTEQNWSPDKMVARMNVTLEEIVKKHPELQGQFDNVQVSFRFAKLKTDEALLHLRTTAEQEFCKFYESKVINAVWSGVKAELQKDLARFSHAFKHGDSQNAEPGL